MKENYVVTSVVTKIGMWLGVAVVVIAAITGSVTSSQKLFGFIGGAFSGAIVAIPFLMFCEMAHAIVSIAKNTSKSGS